MANDRTITAKSLLLAFLELRRMSPEFADWTEERLADNPPRLFRLRQLVAMFRAFDLPWDPASFIKGKFILPDQSRYSLVFSRLVAEMRKGLSDRCNTQQLHSFFDILYEYREQVDGVLSFSSGVMEASGLYMHAHHKANELNGVIQGNIAIIDDILVALISPEAVAFSVKQLTQDFSYPDVDLSEIELEWW